MSDTTEDRLVFNCPECGQLTSNRTFERHGKEIYEAEQDDLRRWFQREAFYPSVEEIMAETTA